MADSWTCNTCNVTLRCSCNSSECGFDYDIRGHIRLDLKKAISTALLWMTKEQLAFHVERVLEDHE
jgi:hypothetical protein